MEDLNRTEEVQDTTPADGDDSANLHSRVSEVMREQFGVEKTFKDIFGLARSVESARALGIEVDQNDPESIAKALREADKAFSEKGREKSTRKESTRTTNPEDVALEAAAFLADNPEARLVWDDLKEAAKDRGVSVTELYEKSTYFKNEAKALYRQRQETEGASAKMSAPSPFLKDGSMDFSKLDPSNPDHMRKVREAGKSEEFLRSLARR